MNKVVHIAYYWTYLNILIFSICIIIWLMEFKIYYPDEWSRVSLFSLFCSSVFFSSPFLCLYMRDKFDLISMEDGNSYVSQWIWIVMSLSVNALAAFTQFLWISEVMGAA